MADALVLDGVTKRYPNGRGIKNVSFSVPKGEIFGFLGPNGAGKTTTIRTIMDFMRPDKGTITILDLDAHDSSVTAKYRIGYVPADRQLYPNWTGEKHLALYRSMRPKSKLDVSKKLNLDIHTPVKHLSTGNKQKLAIALALCGQPDLLIMDEPTAGLDPLLQQAIYEILAKYKQAGGTIFLSSHNLGEVEKICDRVGIIKDGRIVADRTMQDIRDMNIHEVSVVSDKPLALTLANVQVIHETTNHTSLRVTGDLNPLLSQLAKHKVADLEITHASLEDIFLEFYS